jgi:hypothetical protein
MKKLWILPALVLFLNFSCNNAEKKADDIKQAEMAFNSYGQEISSEGTLTSEEMTEKYKSLKPGDTLQVKFKTTITSVCQNKGCWMTLYLPEVEEDVMVKFKDYGFFVPKDIEQKEVIVNGKAFIEEVSVEEQRHYAEDNGQTEAEIEAITQPKRTLSFLADGVLIKE